MTCNVYELDTTIIKLMLAFLEKNRIIVCIELSTNCSHVFSCQLVT